MSPRTAVAMTAALPASLIVVVGLVLAAMDGGFSGEVWYPAALFVLMLAVLTVLVAPPEWSRLPRAVAAGIALYAAFVGWSYLSIAWAEMPAEAWDAANRNLLYGIAFGVATLRPWGRLASVAVLATVGFGAAALAAGTLAATALSGDPTGLFLEARLSEPIGYANATAAVWLIGLWPCLHLAVTRTIRWQLRGLAFACACALLEIAVLAQSRGAAVGLAVAALVYVVLVPRRWPAVVGLGAAVGATALAWGTLTSVREAGAQGALEAAIGEARGAIVLTFLVALALGTLGAYLDRRPVAVLSRPSVARAGNWVLAGAAAIALVAAVAAIGSPGAWLDARWQDFKTTGYERVEGGGSRFVGSLGSNRYDYYRVALNEFRDHPLRGIGADNFAGAYLEHRRSPEAPRYPHSLAFRLLAGVGAVGTVLFAGFLVLALLAAGLAMRRCSPAQRGLAVAAIAGFSAFLGHGMTDWLWTFPALGLPAFVLLGVAAQTFRDRPCPEELMQPGRTPGWRPSHGLGTVAVVVVAAIAAISYVLPGLAARMEASAYETVSRDPEAAINGLERAADVNFLDGQPLIGAAVIARRTGDTGRARELLELALEREPGDWFAHFELGLLLAQTMQTREAQAQLALAGILNPRQELVPTVASALLRGDDVDATAIEQELYRQLGSKLRPAN